MVNKEKTQDGIKQEYNWISVVGERRDRAETESESVCLQKSDGRIAKLSSCMRCEIAGIVCGSIYIDREHILEYTADSWIVNYFKIINVHGPLQWIQYCASEALRSNAKVLTQHADRRVAVTPGSKSIATSTKTAGISKSLGIDSISSCVGDRSVAISMNSRSIAACIGPKSFAYQEGRGGLAVSTGYRSESRADCNGIAFAMGRHGVVSGTYGCWIGCAEYGDDGVTIVNIKFAFVDNVKIKEYTRYKLRDGEFVPVDEQ